MPRKLYLAAYDVRSPSRLARAVRVIKGYASGGQKSAYECWLTPAERTALHQEMAEVIDPDEDQFALLPLEPRRPLVTLGAAEAPADPDFFYFG
ncbi:MULTISPECIES: CRISPR-associated endonuclease Cas2 [unclassified Halorhodospira]|uniref:CRISPR-associated endonuclease Cas2 n=1 Tax=unclassified Halorhodospira TaxID=2626748 RepID=UPI001EE8EAB8|nr:MULTISPECIES: CRISPR-associated endonuclease Cas2 [unclassified Halorhodospira]MCG5541925.1 CRISPR-associated endonuclease Cas2 [Halorhodospira sp. M39old]MCG5546998.1 CRISPR-associated endonuclease Cas2 [Halorhodospira sp. M38]